MGPQVLPPHCRLPPVKSPLTSAAVIGCDRLAHAQFMILGHAAGTAAAVALESGVAVQRADLSRLSAKLREEGMVLDV
jgi:hypothetical protein